MARGHREGSGEQERNLGEQWEASGGIVPWELRFFTSESGLLFPRMRWTKRGLMGLFLKDPKLTTNRSFFLNAIHAKGTFQCFESQSPGSPEPCFPYILGRITRDEKDGAKQLGVSRILGGCMRDGASEHLSSCPGFSSFALVA